MTKLSENDIEQMVIEDLQAEGYEYIYGPDVAPDSTSNSPDKRESFADVILVNRLKNAIDKFNPSIPANAKEFALSQVLRFGSGELMTDNEQFHKMLTEGITVEYMQGTESRGDLVWLMDFVNPANNDFVESNQYTIIENNINKRPDLILFLNGLPLVVIELKNAGDENATITSAYKQLQTYKATIPLLFNFNALCIISDGLDARSGTLSAPLSRFLAWKTSDGKQEAGRLDIQITTLVKGQLNKNTLVDLVRYFTVYEKSNHVDSSTGLTTINSVKKVAAYHQYYAVNKAVESSIKASAVGGNMKGGVVWHTQGSGKSLSMVFYAGKIIQALNNPTILVITDRNDLDEQLFDTFSSSVGLLRQTPVQANDRKHLKDLLKVASGGVVFTTIQKFQPDEGNIYETLTERVNVIVIADEAHRTQYGFSAKTIDDKDDKGNVIGSKIVYGFAKYMRDALPNATYLGFTGTPIESTDVNTPAVFGTYVDIYDIAQAVEDGATVKIFYESRLAKVNLSTKGKKLVGKLDSELDQSELSETQKSKAKWTQLEALVGSEKRVKNIALDIVTHFEQRQEVSKGKGMIVSMSRRICSDLYDEIIKLKPEWHSDDLDKGVIKVVMTSSSSDGPKMAKHNTSKDERKKLADRMRDTNDELELVIVRDMWLTGFDAPSMHTLYIDKPMKGHNLMQAIARVNRVYKDKPGGLVVDYLGIASDLKKALSFYSDSGGKGDPTVVQEQAVELTLEKLELVSQMFTDNAGDIGSTSTYAYENYFGSDTKTKLEVILGAVEYILHIDYKKKFIDEVTALSKAFAIAVPHEEAMDVKDEIAFFQAVKARLMKFDVSNTFTSTDEMETAIRQVIDQALVSEQVVDVFDAAGIKKPDVSIFSEEFLMEIQGMKHENLALETLRKLLNDEIKSRSLRNLIQGKTLMEMLENSIKKYQNKILTAAEVIQELIDVANEIKEADSRGEKMGLSDYELAFYDAVADNDSAKELMDKEKLRELAVVLFERVRKNASIDWTIKENVKAKLKVIVKRTLRQFGYPPDMQKLATETVLKQAELLATQMTNS